MAREKFRWNKPAKRWYYYLSNYKYSPEKKRGIDERTTVGYFGEDGKFHYTERYLLLRKAFGERKTLETKARVQALRTDIATKIADERVPYLISYPLDITFTVCFLSALAGSTSCQGIAEYWRLHRSALEDLFPDFPEKDISHDTIRRVFMIHNPKEFESLFKQYADTFVDHFANRIVNIDGQNVRATKSTAENKRGKYVVSVYDSDSGVTLTHALVGDKTNEIPVAQTLIEQMDLSGCTVTADALHGQSKTANAIIGAGGNYCLAIKSNQGKLRDTMELYLNSPGGAAKSFSKTDKGHGRLEERTVVVLPAACLPKTITSRWLGLEEGCIAMSVEKRTILTTGETTEDRRYFATSIPWDLDNIAERVSHTIRRHWSIENELHHVLDVNLGQDAIQCKNTSYLLNRLTLIKLANNLHSKYRQIQERDTGETVSKSSLLSRMSTPDAAIKCWIAVRKEYA